MLKATDKVLAKYAGELKTLLTPWLVLRALWARQPFQLVWRGRALVSYRWDETP